ncbi:MAG: hypothetical protein QNL61_01235 [Crocinitomicaceae bacterium]
MQFIEPKLEIIVSKLERLKETDKPLWGSMSAQRMVEHLSDSIRLAFGDHSISLQIPEDKVKWAQDFLRTDVPLPKNFEAVFAKPKTPFRNNNIQSAISDFKSDWRNFESHFAMQPETKTLHPYFGELDFELWKTMHSKHITHHLEQFGVVV